MANKRRSYSERVRFWRRVEYVALAMVVATAVLIYLLFV